MEVSRPRPRGRRRHVEEAGGRPIGVFDSGVGGLTVVRELIEILPGEDIIYFGDTARVPYGTKSAETVKRFARQDLDFLKKRGVKMIVIACNTASSIALPGLAEEEEVPVIGVLLPGARGAAAATSNGRIAVIGTAATVRSGAYERALREISADLEIMSHPCPLFVSLAEEGWVDGEVTYMVAGRYLEPVSAFGADTLVLGCTHYPLLKGVISAVMGDGVTLVDSASETAADVERVLSSNGLLSGRRSGGRIEVFLSDIPSTFREVGERFLGRPIERVEHFRDVAGDAGEERCRDTTAERAASSGR
jgi:glutamate racemase